MPPPRHLDSQADQRKGREETEHARRDAMS